MSKDDDKDKNEKLIKSLVERMMDSITETAKSNNNYLSVIIANIENLDMDDMHARTEALNEVNKESKLGLELHVELNRVIIRTRQLIDEIKKS